MERYSVEIICFQALFFGAYWVFFRKNTFFRIHRAYLLIAPVVALLLPFVQIEAFQATLPEAVTSIFLTELTIGEVIMPAESAALQLENSQWALKEIYLIGVLFSAILFIVKFYKIAGFFKFRKGATPIVDIPQSKTAFTFLNQIFIGEEIDPLSRKHILAHEYIHVKQQHTLDLLLFEFLRVLLWFNPFVYLFQKEITLVHEYLADQGAAAQITKNAYYEKLLNTAFGTNNLSFINTFFSQSLIKNRIIMLQKSKSPKIEVWKYVLVIPLFLSMLFYVSCTDDNRPDTQSSLEQQIIDLQLAIETNENVSDQEVVRLKELLRSLESKGMTSTIETQLLSSKDDLAFSSVDTPPLYPGCSNMEGTEEQKECFGTQLNKYVAKNFNTELGSQLNLTGIQRLFTIFKIDKNGDIIDIKVRAPHPDLEEEVKRVLRTVPTMERPARYQGQAVTVSYTLPIVFKIEE